MNESLTNLYERCLFSNVPNSELEAETSYKQHLSTHRTVFCDEFMLSELIFRQSRGIHRENGVLGRMDYFPKSTPKTDDLNFSLP